MSRRALQALTEDPGHVLLKQRLRNTESVGMMAEECLQTEVERLRQALAATKDESEKQLQQLQAEIVEMEETTRTHRVQVEEAIRARGLAAEQVDKLGRQLDETEMRAELKQLRALEQLRMEHREAIHRQQNEVDRERQQAQERVQTLTDAFNLEKCVLQRQLEVVTTELQSFQKDFESRESVGRRDDPPTMAEDVDDTEDGVTDTVPHEGAEPPTTVSTPVQRRLLMLQSLLLRHEELHRSEHRFEPLLLLPQESHQKSLPLLLEGGDCHPHLSLLKGSHPPLHLLEVSHYLLPQ